MNKKEQKLVSSIIDSIIGDFRQSIIDECIQTSNIKLESLLSKKCFNKLKRFDEQYLDNAIFSLENRIEK